MHNMPPNFVDLVVTSPPYDGLRKYNGYCFDFEATAKGLFRVLKPGGVIVWVVNDQTVKGSETGTSFKQALFFMSLGLNLHDTMIFCHGGKGACGSIYGYWQDFEYMFIFTKGKLNTFNPIEDRRNKVEPGTKYTPTRSRTSKGLTGKSRTAVTKEFGRRFNVWTYNGAMEKTGHPAMFPDSLAKDHILSWSNPGDLVYDPFLGSGTTAKMAVLTGRHFIGSETSCEYVELSKNRIASAKLEVGKGDRA